MEQFSLRNTSSLLTKLLYFVLTAAVYSTHTFTAKLLLQGMAASQLCVFQHMKQVEEEE
jgi:hypothetical protein